MSADHPLSAPLGGQDHTVDRRVALLVNPLVADALALERQIAHCGPVGGTGPGAADSWALLPVFAEQLHASAELMAACVRGAGGAPRTRRTDRRATGSAAHADEIAGTPADRVRRLLADEDALAGHLRQVIAACDEGEDEGTADRIQEVLEEVEQQRSVLRDLLRALRDDGTA